MSIGSLEGDILRGNNEIELDRPRSGRVLLMHTSAVWYLIVVFVVLREDEVTVFSECLCSCTWDCQIVSVTREEP